jgi:hypothetical protein
MIPQNEKNDNQYLENLWWAMHHSDDPARQAFAAICYLDESGTDHKNPKVVVAGLLLAKSAFFSFDEAWTRLLSDQHIAPPLHMNEFGEDGRLGGFSYKERQRLFSRVVKLINSHKSLSISSFLDRNAYESYFPFKKAMSMYGLCFIKCLHTINSAGKIAKPMSSRLAIVLDNTTEHKGDILRARDVMLEARDGMYLDASEYETLDYIGSITFDDDKLVSPLQAADVIAWSARKRSSGLALDRGFEPLSSIFNNFHVDSSFRHIAFRSLCERLQREIPDRIDDHD